MKTELTTLQKQLRTRKVVVIAIVAIGALAMFGFSMLALGAMAA